MSFFGRRRLPKSETQFPTRHYNLKQYSPEDIRKIFTYKKTLGSGAFGTAKLYTVKKTGDPIVIKEVPLKDLDVSRSVSEFINFIKLTKHRRMTHLVKYYDIGIIKEHGTYKLLFMQEYVENGNLNRFVQNNDVDWYSITIQLFSILQDIHDAGLVHRDIHGDNILIDGDLKLKLGDFGISCFKGVCAGPASIIKPNDSRFDLIEACSMLLDMIPTRSRYTKLRSILDKALHIAYCHMARKGYVINNNHFIRIEDAILAGAMESSEYEIPKKCKPISAGRIKNAVKQLRTL